MILKKKNGFSLIELILVLSISSLAFLSLLDYEKKKAEISAAQLMGDKYVEVGKALSEYIARNNLQIRTQLTVVGAQSGDLTSGGMGVFTSNAGTTSDGSGHNFSNIKLLSTTYTNASAFNTRISIYLKRVYVSGTTDVIQGLVISNTPLIDPTVSAVRPDYIGNMLKKMGSQGGMIFPNANKMTGPSALWSMDNTDFTAISTVGKVGYRTQFEGIADGTYVRLDGTSSMLGDFNMGNYSITNATDITYNGWLYGNNALFNNIITGNITNSANIATRTIVGDTATSHVVEAAAIGSTDLAYANFGNLFTTCINCGFSGVAKTPPNLFKVAQGDVQIGSTGGMVNTDGKLYVKDIVLGDGSNRGKFSNANLSDRLSRYADRGIILVPSPNLTIRRPIIVNTSISPPVPGYACNWTGIGTAPIAKVELVPAESYIQGRVQGPIRAVFSKVQVNPEKWGLSIDQNQHTVGGMTYKAVVVGPDWVIRMYTPDYQGIGALVASTQLHGGPFYDSATGGWTNGANQFVGGKVLAHVYCDYGDGS